MAGDERPDKRVIATLRSLVGGGLALVAALSACAAEPVRIVAAENVYGDIASQIGGGNVAVTSILGNPNQDPHEFEANASTARAIADAKLVVYNGAGYDPWVAKLLATSSSQPREAIEVAQLIRKKSGDNPHLWYHPPAIDALAAALAAHLIRLDPAHREDYTGRLATFQSSMRELHDRIAALRKKHAGTPVTATEPLFDYMAEALGLEMRNGRFQLAVMNGTEPSAAAIVAFEKDLRTRAVKVLLYNKQTGQALAERMRTVAGEAGVPVVAITETEPAGQRYPQWMLSQLDALERALDRR
jgi:zinc/manganese transport system substrate-binding protein